MSEPEREDEEPKTLLGVVQDAGAIADTYRRIALDEDEPTPRRLRAALALIDLADLPATDG